MFLASVIQFCPYSMLSYPKLFTIMFLSKKKYIKNAERKKEEECSWTLLDFL